MISFLGEKEEKKPISFASVEMQKAPRSYVKWILVLASIILILAIFFWIN